MINLSQKNVVKIAKENSPTTLFFGICIAFYPIVAVF